MLLIQIAPINAGLTPALNQGQQVSVVWKWAGVPTKKAVPADVRGFGGVQVGPAGSTVHGGGARRYVSHGHPSAH